MNKFESNKKEKEPSDEYDNLAKEYSDKVDKERAKEKVEPGPHVEEFEKLFASVTNETLGVLNAFETEEEAKNSQERKFAKEVLGPLLEKIKFLENRTNITEDELAELRKKYKVISNAVGIIKRDGRVDHAR